MKRLGRGLLYAVIGYIAGALLGYLLVSGVSSNRHDVGVEAAMTALFVVGPLVMIIAFVFAFPRAGKTPTPNE